MPNSLLLYSTLLNSKIAVIEQNLTDASEQMIILFSQMQQLSEAWQGSAKEQWMKKLFMQHEQAELYIKAAKNHAACIKGLAQILAEIEHNIGLMVDTL